MSTLKDKLREKLKAKKMGRQSQSSLDYQREKLEEKMENARTKREKSRIMKKIDEIQEIEDQRYKDDDFVEFYNV